MGGGPLIPSVIYPSVDAVSLTYDNPTATVTLQIVGDGTLSVSSSDTSVCTASISGTTVNISAPSLPTTTNNTATVTVSITHGNIYDASSIDISVTSEVAIVSWSTGTDAQIVHMVQAADQGLIDLYDDAGWRVGDERTVSLSAMAATGVGESHVAQDVTFVLMQQGLYQDTSGKTVNWIVGMKDYLTEVGYMDSTDPTICSWKNSARRAWCNSTFYNAIPQSIRGCFKQFKTLTASAETGTATNEYTNDYFALPAAAEIFKGDPTYGTGGSSGKTTGYSHLIEFNALTQFEWYATAANRTKYGTYNYYWVRSPYYNNAMFCCVNSGNAAGNGATGTRGISPFGCI